MKKIVAEQFIIDPDRRYKLPIDGLNHIQDSYSELMEVFIKTIVGENPSGAYKIFGCIDNTPGNTDSNISKGAIYYFMDFTAWSSATSYDFRDNCSKGGYSYHALQASINKDPETNPDHWIKLGKHQEGQVFLADAFLLNPITDTIVCEIQATFIPIDPTEYTDNTTHNSHPIFKIGYKDAASGSGIVDFNDLKTENFRNKYVDLTGADISALVGSYTVIGAGMNFKIFNNISIINFVVNISGGNPSNQNIYIDLPSGVTGEFYDTTCISSGDINEVCRIKSFGNQLLIQRVDSSSFPIFSLGTQFTGQVILFR